jgi:hypothetical protein
VAAVVVVQQGSRAINRGNQALRDRGAGQSPPLSMDGQASFSLIGGTWATRDQATASATNGTVCGPSGSTATRASGP